GSSPPPPPLAFHILNRTGASMAASPSSKTRPPAATRRNVRRSGLASISTCKLLSDSTSQSGPPMAAALRICSPVAAALLLDGEIVRPQSDLEPYRPAIKSLV